MLRYISYVLLLASCKTGSIKTFYENKPPVIDASNYEVVLPYRLADTAASIIGAAQLIGIHGSKEITNEGEKFFILDVSDAGKEVLIGGERLADCGREVAVKRQTIYTKIIGGGKRFVDLETVSEKDVYADNMSFSVYARQLDKGTFIRIVVLFNALSKHGKSITCVSTHVLENALIDLIKEEGIK